MGPNPLLGVLFHWIGGLAAASFYLPYKRVKGWSWETYWLVGGFFSWIIAPSLLSLLLVPDSFAILAQAPAKTLFWTFFFGLLWGIGGLTFGLTVRYLGLALGYALALGSCAAFGTLIPPLFNGTFPQIASSTGGRVTLFGVFVCLLGIATSGLAGKSKENEMTEDEKKAAVAEFNFTKGLSIALLCGIMSACMAFAFAAGVPIAQLAKTSLLTTSRRDIWQQLPVLIVILWGGFLTNLLWCLYLHLKNRSLREYISPAIPSAMANQAPIDAHAPSASSRLPTPQHTSLQLPLNYLFSALAGITWYFQFFFYSMGETKMGEYGFSSWTLHMASIIIFSTLWGVALHEWKGASTRTRRLIVSGLVLLIVSTLLVGLGNYLAASKT